MSLRRRSMTALLAVAALLCSTPAVAQDAEVPVKEVTLDNGMKLLMVERHESPTVSAGWVTHVGSVNEEVGATGIAHLFEHMMFKGTRTIGTKNYQRDLQIIAAQEQVRDQMRQEERKMRAGYRLGEIDDHPRSAEYGRAQKAISLSFLFAPCFAPGAASRARRAPPTLAPAIRA